MLAYYYTGFPLVRITGDTLTSWTNDAVSGAFAVAASGARVVLVGGYSEHRDRLVVGTLDGDRLRVDRTTKLTLPDGGPLPRYTYVVGRGDCLHLVAEGTWYRLDVDDIG